MGDVRLYRNSGRRSIEQRVDSCSSALALYVHCVHVHLVFRIVLQLGIDVRLSKVIREFFIICVSSSKSVLLVELVVNTLLSTPLPDEEKSSSTPSSSFDEGRR